ncbi:MAG: hypothetical protein AAF587_24925 [Bacteroidota bacterium]
MNISNIVAMIILVIGLMSCKTERIGPQPVGNLNPALGIEAVPASLGKKYTRNFNRYTKVSTPNGGAIHIVAQSNISNEQILRCRSILEHFLQDYEGSAYGSDKAAIANQMAENNATLTLLNGRDDGRNRVRVPGQALFEEEIQVEGNDWYVSQSYQNHRDAAFEEILHLVHDTGIGVDGPNSQAGASPEFQQKIRAAQEHALNNNIWGMGADDWIKELTKENSLSQEYLAAVIDSYYGLWGAWTESSTHGMWGLYLAKTREEISQEDPMGEALMHNSFFHPYLTYNARIDSGFSGVFSLAFNSSIPYTHHSRYLKDITLLGKKDTDVKVNELNNDITGNGGINQVIFSGKYAEYQVETLGEETIVSDNMADRDGDNKLRNIEQLQFSDQTIDL